MLPRTTDPLLLTWDPLGTLGRHHDERSWTQWLGGLFADLQCGIPAWSALCKAVANAGAYAPTEYADGGRDLATPDDWLRAAQHRPQVFVEELTGDGGFVDLRIRVGGLSVVVENKHWEPWHDRAEKRQHLTCSDWARENAAVGERVGLVFLSVYAATETCPGWAFVTWRDLARELRRILRHADSDERPTVEHLSAAPIAFTVASIEKHLLGLKASALAGGSSRSEIRDLMNLAEILKYLEECQ
jgi:hypothetical protein